jgi:hypothetical protein
MALVGTHQTLTFSSPVLSGAGVNANVVRGNDNVLRTALNAHDDDASIHVQSGTFANRPTTIADGSTYFCTDTRDTYSRVAGAWVQSGWAHWYGGFSDYTDQTHTAINTAKAITFDTTDLSRGVTVVSTSRLTVAYAGDYNLMWSGQFVNTDSQIRDVDVWVRKNGTDVAGSAGRVSVPNKHGSVDGHLLPAWNYFFTLAANDYLELYWAVTDTALSLQTNPASAWAPSTASVIVTLNRI